MSKVYDDNKLMKSYSELIKSGEIEDINDFTSFSQFSNSFKELNPINEITSSSLNFKEYVQENTPQKILHELNKTNQILSKILVSINQLKN